MPALRSILLHGLLFGLFPTILALSSANAWSQARIVPSGPLQFERVSLRQTVDSCMFDESAVSVAYEHATIVVVQPPLQCFAPGPPQVVDIQLGAFPPGNYVVEVYHSLAQPPLERVAFTVSGLVYPAVYPPVPFPIADYSGIWRRVGESGWGVSLHQGSTHTLVGAIYVYATDREPEWYLLQSGRWVSATKWSGEIGKLSGPPWSAPVFDPGQVQVAVVGTVTLDFTMEPGKEDLATLTYTIDGTTVTKSISRLRL